MSTITTHKFRDSKSVIRMAGIAFLISSLFLVGCISISTDGEHGEGAADENQVHTFEVGDNPTIDVSGFNGELEIIAGADGVVKVEAKLRIPNRVSYSASVSGNTVSIVAEKIGNGITIGRSPQAKIYLIVPAHSTITAHTSNGPLTIDGIIGSGILETSNGPITIKNVNGKFSSSTSNGSVRMVNVTGEFDAKTSNGKISYSGTFTSGGENDFTTSNGSIDVTFSDEPNVALDARTSNGTVSSDRPILATINERSFHDRAHIEGKYGDGSAFLELSTSNGSINIH